MCNTSSMSAQVRTTSWIPTFKQHQTIATDTLLTHDQHILHASMSRNYVPSNNTCHMSGQCCRHTPQPCVTHTYLEATLPTCLTTATGAVLIHTQHVLHVRVRQDRLVHAHLQRGQSAKHHPISCSRKWTSKNLICCSRHMHPTCFKRFGKKHEVERTQKSYIWQVEFLAAGKTIFWPTPHSKETAIDTCGFSAVGTLICVYR